MRIFITGATGWVGSATVGEFVAAGHDVVGLVRSESGAQQLSEKGVTPLIGDLDDLDGLRRGAEDADGVVHLANKHSWSDPAAMNSAERTAVHTLGETLAGSGKPFLIASAVAGVAQGRPATESDVSPATGIDSMRGGSENLALEYADKGVRAIIVRFAPSVHGTGDRGGFVAAIVRAARQKEVSAYIEDGSNAWSAVARADTAHLIRLAVEQAPAGSRLHAVAEQAVPTRAIAEAIGAAFDLPVTSVPADRTVDQFGFTGRFFGMDLRASSDSTRELLGWTPTGPTLIDDITAGAYRNV